MRSSAALVVALLVATAGCNVGLDPAGTPAPPETPTPGTSPTGTPAPRTPVGISVDGVTDPLRLSRAHVTALENRSFTVRYERVVVAANGTRMGVLRRTGKTARGWQRYSSRVDASGLYTRYWAGRQLVFSNGSAAFVLIEWRNRTTYQRLFPRQAPATPGTLAHKTTIYLLFSAIDTRVVDVERHNGTVRYRLQAAPDAGPLRYRDGNATNVTLTSVVERSGLVRSIRLEYDTDQFGFRGHVVVRLQFTRIGATSVPEPPWVDRVRANTSSLPDR